MIVQLVIPGQVPRHRRGAPLPGTHRDISTFAWDWSPDARGHIYIAYILASGRYGTLYAGVTNDLYRRVTEHREGRGSKFTRRYKVSKLMWFQEFGWVDDAIQREKSIKNWPRAWKINLIERTNPDWHDLFPAMQKYEPKGPLSGASLTMGPGQLRRRPEAAGLARDDT